MRFALLGPLDVRRDDGSPVALGGVRLRSLLALLLLDTGRVVATERLLDGLYGDDQPQGAANALQSQVSRLRRRLGGDAPAITSHPAGYRLDADPDSVDAHRFERLCGEGRRVLRAGDHHRASALLTEALALWRGDALADLADAPFTRAQAARLDSARLAALEDRVEADLAIGRTDLTGELTDLAAAWPLRERFHAQLMRALADRGRQAEALRVYETIRDRLAEELGADPSAELAETHLAVLRAKPADGSARRITVPARFTSFIGRDTELAAVRGLLATSRLVTVTGPGGTGKTRLAVEAAGPAAVFADLSETTTADEVPYALLTALGLRQNGILGGAAEAADPLDRVATALAGEELLIILDNCEHVVDAAARAAGRLLGAVPGLRILATSREALGITGETALPLPPLGAEAARLFTDRAAAARGGAALAAGDAELVQRICHRLDGLPLAIELAAARLRRLPLADLADRLADRFRALSRGDRSAAPRHQTLRAVVEWSWDLLGGDERAMLRRLTAFAGGATPASAAAICGLSADDAEDLLADLADKSLLTYADGRYGMLNTVHDFAAAQLAAAGEEQRIRAAHAAHFADLAARTEPVLRGRDQLTALAGLDAESANLQAALRWAVGADHRLALDLLADLVTYRWLRGMRGEDITAVRDLLAALDDVPEGQEEAYACCVAQAVLAGVEEGDGPHRRRALAVFDAIGSRPVRPFTSVLAAMATGPGRDVIEAPAEALHFADDPWSQGLASLGAGMVRGMAGELERAEHDLTEAIDGFRGIGERWGMMQSLDALAEIVEMRGDPGRALSLSGEALAAAVELGCFADVAELRCRRADVLARAGDLDAAEAEYLRAGEEARRCGVSVTRAAAASGRARVAFGRGDHRAARDLYGRALADCGAGAFVAVLARAQACNGLGDVDLAEDRLDDAAGRYAEALAVAAQGWYLPAAADAARGIAEVTLARGDAVDAAWVLGAGRALRGTRASWDPVHRRAMAAVREAAGGEAFDTAYAMGAALDRERALTALRERS